MGFKTEHFPCSGALLTIQSLFTKPWFSGTPHPWMRDAWLLVLDGCF